jgi:hypothetical protein
LTAVLTLPLSPGVPERLVGGNEYVFLNWSYHRHTAQRDAIKPATVDESGRTFSGREGVLGAMSVYRVAFTSTEQTATNP